LKGWLKANSDLYDNKFTVLYHGTDERVPAETVGLLPTSRLRRRSYQSTSGYVYLAATPERARSFGNAGNGGRCCVYAVVVPVRKLLADMDQITNQRSVGRGPVGNSVAESLVFSGSVRVKRRIEPWAIRKVIQ
jgi:hypothetical protein